MKAAFFALLWLLLNVSAAYAHGERSGPVWTFDLWITVPLLLSAVLYGRGAFALWRRSRFGRTTRLRQAVSYAAGWLSLIGALVSPLHWLGEQLFTAHMVEHEIVMTVAAPLLVLARPGGTFLWSFDRRFRRVLGQMTREGAMRGFWAILTRPLTATLLHAVAIWVWHVPIFFDAAVTDITLHRLQHLSFFVTAVLFWWSLIWRADPAVATGELFVTMVHTGILGALMTFAPRVLYGVQTSQAPSWGLTPLEDQQLAGLVMWVPVGTVYAGAALAFVMIWIRRSSAIWKANRASAS